MDIVPQFWDSHSGCRRFDPVHLHKTQPRARIRVRGCVVGLCVLLALGPSTRTEAEQASPVSSAQVDEVVRAHLGELEGCYRRERKRLEVSTGRIDVNWTFGGKGEVVRATPVVDTLGAPELRECLASAVRRWRFPHFSRGGWVEVTMAFAFAPRGVSFGKAAATVSAVPELKAPRALLLRFGPELVSFACVAGRRSFLGRVCDTPINHSPRVGLDRRYTTDRAVATIHPALVRFEHDEVDANGFSLEGWPQAPADGRKDSGPFDGFAVWPPDAFQVQLSPHGERVIADGVKWCCWERRWSPCRDADRPGDGGFSLPWQHVDSAPLAEGALARDAERLLAPILARFTESRRIRLLQTLSVDLDGDGKMETLHNLAVTDVEPRDEKVESPTTFFFILLDRNGRLSRLPVDTAPSREDGMDGAIVATVDVDGDNGRELVIETPGYEMHTWQVVRLRDGAFHPVAEFGYAYMGQAVGW